MDLTMGLRDGWIGIGMDLPAVPEAAGKALEVWFQDEARVGQQGTPSYVWRRAARVRRVRDCRHDSAYLFGAVCPAPCRRLPLVMPGEQRGQRSAAPQGDQQAGGGHISPRPCHCDGASAGTASRACGSPRTSPSLLRLPPYAPELNPMENVGYLRANQLSMTVGQLPLIVDACCDA
jgi:hypothetical protein